MHLVNIVAVTLSLAGQITAYGDLGHRTVALLAHKYLNDATKDHLNVLLANDRGFDFSDAATWADTIKRGKNARLYTKKWHYIDAIDIGEDKKTTPTGCALHYPADCTHQGPDGCIITAMANQTALFTNPSSSALTRKEALMFLMHFFGDLHQPLHVEDAFTGGNEIETCFRRACAGNNLHKIWDSYIPNKLNGLGNSPTNEEEKDAAALWAERLYERNIANGIEGEDECADVANPNTCTLAWARESNSWICRYVMQPNVDWLENNDLSLGYYEGAAPIVEELIGKAGLRLGGWLNALVVEAARKRVGENLEL